MYFKIGMQMQSWGYISDSRPISKHAYVGLILADSMPHHMTAPCFRQHLAERGLHCVCLMTHSRCWTGPKRAMQVTHEKDAELAACAERLQALGAAHQDAAESAAARKAALSAQLRWGPCSSSE